MFNPTEHDLADTINIYKPNYLENGKEHEQVLGLLKNGEKLADLLLDIIHYVEDVSDAETEMLKKEKKLLSDTVHYCDKKIIHLKEINKAKDEKIDEIQSFAINEMNKRLNAPTEIELSDKIPFSCAVNGRKLKIDELKSLSDFYRTSQFAEKLQEEYDFEAKASMTYGYSAMNFVDSYIEDCCADTQAIDFARELADKESLKICRTKLEDIICDVRDIGGIEAVKKEIEYLENFMKGE